MGEKYHKAKEWKTPAVSVQWLNDVLFGNMNADQIMHNPKYHNFRLDDPFRIDYSLVPHLISAWKIPIRVTPETYQKFKANPPARIKRKAEKQRLEKEEAKRLREAAEMQHMGSKDPASGAGNNNDLQTTNQQSQFAQPGSMGRQPSYQQQIPSNDAMIIQQHNQQQQEQHQDQSSPRQLNGTRENDTKEVKKEVDTTIDKKNQFSTGHSKQLDAGTAAGPRIIFTGFVKSTLREMTAIVADLGGEVVPAELISTATHLVMPVLDRTISMMCALSYVNHILKADWVRESRREKKWLGEL